MQFEVIELCAAESLIEREQAHISEWFDHPRCMNLSPTAGSTLGVKHTDEARRNMSEAHQGCWKEKRHPMLGKPRSKETREKLRAANLGKRFSDERKALHKAAFAHPGVRMKMALSRMGRTQSAETIEKRMKNCRGGDNYRARRCRLIFLDGSDLIFPCVSDAAKHVNISHVTLVNWLLGKKPWPGDGAFLRGKTKNLIGLKGEYLP
jgi:group I intron endonuclease